MREGQDTVFAQTQEVVKELEATITYAQSKLDASKKKRPFVIVMCGAFSTGKTSLLNALLGCSLPTGITPITKTVTKLRYGRMERVIVKSMESGEEWEVSLEDANAIIVNKNKVERYRNLQVLIEMPSSFLQKGIVMVDTPGFEDNEKEKLDELSKKEIRESDFCIVNFTSNRFGSNDERQFLTELQQITNGNFISVINCMNYLMQEGQVDDLEKRAHNILTEFGNSRIGMGRYFMVDSRESQNAELGGLDEWLNNLLEYQAHIIQTDTPLSIALVESRKAARHANECIFKIAETIVMLQEKNEKSIRNKKCELCKIHEEKMVELRNHIFDWQDSLEQCVEKAIKKADLSGAECFQKKAEKKIKKKILKQAEEMDHWILEVWKPTWNTAGFEEGKIGKIQEKTNQDGLWWMFLGITVLFSLPKTVCYQHERGILDIDRYLLGKNYTTYNDYVTAAINACQQELFPLLRNTMKQYANEQEEQMKKVRRECVIGGYEKMIREAMNAVEGLAEKSLELLELQHEIRMRRKT